MATTLTVVSVRGAVELPADLAPGVARIDGDEGVQSLGFGSAADALATAFGLLSWSAVDGSRPAIGIDVGDVDLDAAPASAVLAGATRRACAAAPGQVLVSELVRLLLREVADADFEPIDEPPGSYALVRRSPSVLEGLGLPPQLVQEPTVPFVDRPEAWATLDGAWRAARGGRGRTVLVSGEAGSGKTRLLAELGRVARAGGGIVLYGTSSEDVEVPFQPFVEALGPMLDSATPDELDALLPDASRRDLAQLLPSSQLGPPPRPPAGPAGQVGAEAAGERHWAFEAAVDLLANLGKQRPVLLLLDDLHWAQRPTCRLAGHLLRSGRLDGVCIVVAHRHLRGEQTDGFAELLDDLDGRHGVKRCTLAAFDEGAIRRFVAGAAGSDDVPEALESVAALLGRRTDGNPFLLAESWDHLLATGCVRRGGAGWEVGPLRDVDSPGSVREATMHRLGHLPPSCRALVELAACAGAEFDVPLVAAAAGTTVATALDELTTAESGGLVTAAAPGRRRFVHALVRQAIEEGLSTGSRRRLHLAIAQALVSSNSTDDAVLARHFAAAVPLVSSSVAVAHARAAASRSLQTVAFDDAIAVLEGALAVATKRDERIDLLTDLAAVFARATLSEQAVEASWQAADLARQAGDARRLVRAARTTAEATWLGALDASRAVSLVQEALATGPAPDVRGALLGALSATLALAGRDDESAATAQAAVALADELEDDPLVCEVVTNSLYATVTPQTAAGQLELARRAIEIACRRGDEYDELRLRCKALLRLFVMSDPDDLRHQLARHDELASQLRLPYYLRFSASNEVTVSLAEGRFADAERAVERYQAWMEVLGLPDTGYGVQMFSIRREQGRLAELRPMLELGARLRPEERAWGPGLAVVYAEADMVGHARGVLDELASDGLASLPRDSLLPGVLSYLADAALATRHRPVAELIEPLLRPYAGLLVYLPGLVCYGAASRYLGKVYDVLGRAEVARSHYEAALELDERTGWRCWIAHSQFALGLHLLERRRRAERQRGVSLLESARRLADELGMGSLVGRCDAARGQLRADGLVGAERALTPREHEVLALVAEGWSNREIGDRLHASQHTIANHVRAILAKTGCANRTEATAWALRHTAAERPMR